MTKSQPNPRIVRKHDGEEFLSGIWIGLIVSAIGAILIIVF